MYRAKILCTPRRYKSHASKEANGYLEYHLLEGIINRILFIYFKSKNRDHTGTHATICTMLSLLQYFNPPTLIPNIHKRRATFGQPKPLGVKELAF